MTPAGKPMRTPGLKGSASTAEFTGALLRAAWPGGPLPAGPDRWRCDSIQASFSLVR